jgi:hypothetical protein
MASLEEAARLAMELPDVTEGDRYGGRTWSVRDKVFAWERPFTKADIKRFAGEAPPSGHILAVRTADVHEKEAILAEGQKGFFTIPHLNGYPALLIQLKAVGKKALREAIVDAWLAQAPKKLADEFLNR